MTLAAQPVDERDERLLAVLAPWLPGRRWFPAKGAAATLTLVGVLPLAAEVRVLLVRARAGSIDALLQVPLVLGPGSGEQIGVVDGLDVRDGAADERFVRAWLAAADGPGTDADPALARVLSGEQSNTSVILGDTAILKVLRALQPGENPDVDVPRRLVEHGWTHVPAPLAWLEGEWVDAEGRPRRGYLGALSAFVAGAADGFELACELASRDASFAELARELGEVTATMHAALARAFPLADAPDGPRLVADGIAQRYSWATSAVPRLASYASGVERVLDEVRALPSTPPRQRVHGDLHLGQVLRAGERWWITDFEGEPLAPLDERTRPDLAVRDLAGLLRSVDYAAAVGGAPGSAWATEARDALAAGYGSSAEDDVLVRALELDKALYEAVYEARNRPDWLAIPLAGLDRLVG